MDDSITSVWNWNYKIANEIIDENELKAKIILTVHGAFYPKCDTEMLYLSRRNGGRNLISCQDCIEKENNLGWYVKDAVAPFLTTLEASCHEKLKLCNERNIKKKKTKTKRNNTERKNMDSLHEIRTSRQIQETRGYGWG